VNLLCVIRYSYLSTSVICIAGCASTASPLPIISNSMELELRKGFDTAAAQINTASAKGDGEVADAKVIANFMSYGLALADLSCKNYFRNLGQSAQNYAFGRKQLGLASGSVAALQGLTGVSAKLVSITASAFSFGIASSESYADVYLYSPDVSGVQELVETAQTAYRAVAPAAEQLKTYGAAISALRDYDKLCETQTIRRLVNESISAAKPVASVSENSNKQSDGSNESTNTSQGSGKNLKSPPGSSISIKVQR